MRQGLECAHGKRGGKLPDSSPSCIPRPAQRWREESARCPRRRRTKRSGGALAPAFGVGAPCAADTHGISQRENAQGKQRGSSHRSRGASHVAEDCWPGRRGGGARGQAGRRGPRAVECRLFRPAITPRGAVGPARPRATARSPRAERLARTAKRLSGAESSLKQLENLSSTTPALEEGRFHPPSVLTETARHQVYQFLSNDNSSLYFRSAKRTDVRAT